MSDTLQENSHDNQLPWQPEEETAIADSSQQAYEGDSGLETTEDLTETSQEVSRILDAQLQAMEGIGLDIQAPEGPSTLTYSLAPSKTSPEVIDSHTEVLLDSEEVTTDAPAPKEQQVVEVMDAPGRKTISVEGRIGSDVCTGSNSTLVWGARSDVGLIREHNEDSFLVQAPLFCVSDGMGGHAAGEVASAITVKTISQVAPHTADDVALGGAIEQANLAVIEGSRSGVGKPGMGCTATAVIIDKNIMAVAHVGDSRAYVLHAGKLVRVTHDHSYVEELVDAGEITADEARVHPDRSMITRALGSDPNMYADHFLIEVGEGDRIILCSDGLSSMVTDSMIETIAVSCATPQQAADNLVAEALTQGGHDNVTVIVVDITDDEFERRHKEQRNKNVLRWALGLTAVFALIIAGLTFIISTNWYLGDTNGHIGIYQGIPGNILGIKLSSLKEVTKVKVADLPDAIQKQLDEGIMVDGDVEAHETVSNYLKQLETEEMKNKEISQSTKENTSSSLTEDAEATNTQTDSPRE